VALPLRATPSGAWGVRALTTPSSGFGRASAASLLLQSKQTVFLLGVDQLQIGDRFGHGQAVFPLELLEVGTVRRGAVGPDVPRLPAPVAQARGPSTNRRAP
jgi:hypothetical protein